MNNLQIIEHQNKRVTRWKKKKPAKSGLIKLFNLSIPSPPRRTQVPLICTAAPHQIQRGAMLMGQAKALVKARTKAAQKKYPWTMHDQDYIRVFKSIERARGRMVPGQVCEEFKCPICGGPAFVFCREQNIGKDYTGGCECGCWDIWE